RQVDEFRKKRKARDNRIEGIGDRLVPVPINRPNAAGADCSLPPQTELTRTKRRQHRRHFGIRDAERIVLFCTAKWQHGHYLKDPDGQRLAAAVPPLLWRY